MTPDRERLCRPRPARATPGRNCRGSWNHAARPSPRPQCRQAFQNPLGIGSIGNVVGQRPSLNLCQAFANPAEDVALVYTGTGTASTISFSTCSACSVFFRVDE